MKKPIISLAIIFAIFIVVKMFLLDGGDGLLLSKKLPHAMRYNGVSFNREIISLDELLGVPLPDSATDIVSDYYGEQSIGANKVKNYEITHWIIAKLPIEDFYNFVEQLNLANTPDLLEFWPEAFDWYDSHPKHALVKLWDITNTVDDKTFYGRNSDEEIYLVAKYENEKLYLKKVMIYISVMNENNQYRWKIKEL